MSELQPNIVETAIAAGRELATAMYSENDTPYIVVPKDHTVQMFPELRDFPLRAEQMTVHTTAQSFLDYYNQYANKNSALFINELISQFTAVFDFHSPDHPDWKKHRSNFELSKTPEWDEWKKHDKKAMSQVEFGTFIENNLTEIITPPGADMLEIALSLQAKTEIKYSSGYRLDNGQMQLTYNEVIDGTAGTKGQLKIPEKFTIGLQLFRGGIPYQMDARLRYRIKDGNLTIWYELIRPHLTVDANMQDTINLISQEITDGKIYRSTVF